MSSTAWDAKTEEMTSKGVLGTSGTLAQEVMSGFVEKRGLILPTPTARDEKNPSSPDGKRIARKVEQRYTIELNDMASMGLLPTPQAGEAEHYRLKYTPGSQMGMGLTAMAAEGMLPMPASRDYKGKTNPGIVKEGSGCVYGETLPDTIDRIGKASLPKDDGGTFRLSPLFTEEMMGFPLMWTTYPFLRQDGEPNPSRPTETPSSHK